MRQTEVVIIGSGQMLREASLQILTSVSSQSGDSYQGYLGSRDMRMIGNKAVLPPQLSMPTGARRWSAPAGSAELARWQTHPECILYLFPILYPVSMESAPEEQIIPKVYYKH